jgi:hypothetical protein
VDRETGRYVVVREVVARTLADAHALVGRQSAEMFVTSKAALQTMGRFPRSA